MEKKKVLILGGGFGGVFAAKELARRGANRFDVELMAHPTGFRTCDLCLRRATLYPTELRVLVARTVVKGLGHKQRRRDRNRKSGAGSHKSRAPGQKGLPLPLLTSYV